MTCKFLTQQERIKSQIEREKKRPLNKLYLQGLKEDITEDRIIEQIKSLFPNQPLQVSVSLRDQVYPQAKTTTEQTSFNGKTALIELPSEEDAEKVFLEIRKSLEFQQFFYPVFLKQNSFIQQFVNKTLRVQFVKIRKQFIEMKKKKEGDRLRQQKQRNVQRSAVSQIERPDFVEPVNPIFNPLEFNFQNLESDLNQSTRTGTNNFPQSQEDFGQDQGEALYSQITTFETGMTD